jgi:hypothetical protein
VPGENGSVTAKRVSGATRLGDRTQAPRKKKAPALASPIRQVSTSDYDPSLEIRSRRLAAQSLRDINRASRDPALVEKAKKLEDEATAIAVAYGLEK